MLTSFEETVTQKKVITTVALADVPVVLPSEITFQNWADEINAATENEVEAILHKAQVLIAAKKALLRHGHGLWEKLFKKNKHDAAAPVRFSVATAKMYMAIAKHPILANRNLGNDLPPNWSALYQLSLIPELALQSFMAAGLITPALSKKDAIMLRVAKSPDRIVVRRDGRLSLVEDNMSDRQYANLAAFEALITPPKVAVLHGRTYRLCGRHWLVIANIVEPPHAWKVLLDGQVAFFPWPDILVADHFGPHIKPVVFVQPIQSIASTILALYEHRYGVEAVELL